MNEEMGEKTPGSETAPTNPTKASKGFLDKMAEKLMAHPNATGFFLAIPIAASVGKSIAQGNYWQALNEGIATGVVGLVVPYGIKLASRGPKG